MPQTPAGSRTPTAEDRMERALNALVTRVSGRALVAICLALYPGLGLAVPLILGWSTINLVSINVLGVGLSAMIGLVWFVQQLQAMNRRHLLDWTTDIRHLNAEEFEWYVGEVFRREGWDVTETGRQDRPDGNVDLRLTKDQERLIVQCKLWQTWQVGIDDVRAFAGTLHAEKPGTRGMFVTFSTFTDAARREAERQGIVLLERHELHLRAEKTRRPEPCPICGKPMTLDRSTRGWWFRCIAAGCSGKRDLAGEPARAVELLTIRPWLESADA